MWNGSYVLLILNGPNPVYDSLGMVSEQLCLLITFSSVDQWGIKLNYCWDVCIMQLCKSSFHWVHHKWVTRLLNDLWPLGIPEKKQNIGDAHN